MHSYDRTLASYFTLAVQLRPESTALAATGLVAPNPFDHTGQWARTEKGALDICARDLERKATDGGWWTILSHPSYARSVLLESVVPNEYPEVDPLEQLPNAQLWPTGVIEHDSEFGSRYWVYTGPDLEEGGWIATDAADRFFQERWSILTSTGWESHGHLSGPPDTADQQAWGERWCIVASAEAVLAVDGDLLFALDAADAGLVPQRGDKVASLLWQWTNGWADEQLDYGVGEAGRKNAEDQLARLDPGLVRDYLRHAATAPAHIAMATAVGARLDTTPASDFELLARLEERAQLLWSVGARDHNSISRWTSWRQSLDTRQQELANQPLHLALERHAHPGPAEQVITRPYNRQHTVDSNAEALSTRKAKPPAPDRPGRAHRGGGRGR